MQSKEEEVSRIRADVCERLSGSIVCMDLTSCGEKIWFSINHFVDVGKLKFVISSKHTRETYHADFGRALMECFVGDECTPGMLEKIFPLITYYKIQHEELENIWYYLIQYDKEFNSADIIIKLMKESGHNQIPQTPELDLYLRQALMIHELSVTVRHCNYFRLLDSIGNNIIHVWPFKRKLLLMEEGRYQIESRKSGFNQKMRHFVYLHSKEYRNLLFRFYSEELFLTLELSRNLIEDVRRFLFYIFILSV